MEFLVGTIFVHTLKKIVILILALHYILLMTCSDTHNRCSFLLSSSDFRLHACEVFKLVCSRYATGLFDLMCLREHE